MRTPPDEFDFCTDGARAGEILVVSFGCAYRCRRPLLREYKQHRGAAADLDVEDDIVWWVTTVVEVLSGVRVDPVPSWFADPTLPARIIDHWRHVPLGPWESKAVPTGGGVLLGNRPLSGVFAELAPIYEACSSRNVPPREADECEIWEIASIMGLHDPDRAERAAATQPTGPGDAPRSAPRARPPNVPDQTSINAARVKAAQSGGPKPQWQREHAAGGEGDLMRSLVT